MFGTMIESAAEKLYTGRATRRGALRRMATAVLVALMLAAVLPALALAESSESASAAPTREAPDAAALMKETHLAMYYAGDDGVADVTMRIVNSRGKERIREFTMMRLDLEEGGRQDYYTYFRRPQDVSRLSFMVHKLPDETDSRWLYVPSVDLIKRISADDKASSFVGSDFTYEDVSGRHWSEDTHRFVKTDDYNGRAVYVIESTPREAYKGFSRKVSFVDAKNKLILREEYYDGKNELARVYTTEKIETHDGIDTAVFRKMENVKKKQYTTVEFAGIRYNVGVKESFFTERYLKNPPREFIQ